MCTRICTFAFAIDYQRLLTDMLGLDACTWCLFGSDYVIPLFSCVAFSHPSPLGTSAAALSMSSTAIKSLVKRSPFQLLYVRKVMHLFTTWRHDTEPTELPDALQKSFNAVGQPSIIEHGFQR